jgi:hypothetical protein
MCHKIRAYKFIKQLQWQTRCWFAFYCCTNYVLTHTVKNMSYILDSVHVLHAVCGKLYVLCCVLVCSTLYADL